MTTVLTETADQPILQLNTTKYISNINTTETSAEISKRSRADKIKNSNRNTLSHVFLTAILYTLHFIYISFIAFKSLYSYLENLLRDTHQHPHDIHQRIQFDKTQLTKIPEHLTINVSRELASTRSCKEWEKLMYDISMSTCWAWDFGIKEVSVYDASGIMKSVSVDLYKQQSTILHDYMIKYNKGEKIRPALKFSILSIENGKQHMGRVVQEMAKDYPDTIDIPLVDQYMHSKQHARKMLLIMS
ncbi:hypothetical protein V8B55DRAFT_1525060 [Mucor lusitanicus]